MDALAPGEIFLKYDYLETKDLLKTFITLISATLVLSITFSEKVINIHKASQLARKLMVLTWFFLVFSLVGAGISLCFISAAAGCALYGSIPILECNVHYYSLISWIIIISSGGLYVFGLATMVLAARQRIYYEDEDNRS